MTEFHDEDSRFDVIFDLVGTREAWLHAKAGVALKSCWKGGKYVTFLGDNPYFEIHSIPQAIAQLWRVLRRVIWTRLWPWLPNYSYHIGLTPKYDSMAKLAKLVEDDHLQIVLDPSSPFPLQLDAVKRAFHLQKSRHAHGKVIVEIAAESSPS